MVACVRNGKKLGQGMRGTGSTKMGIQIIEPLVTCDHLTVIGM